MAQNVVTLSIKRPIDKRLVSQLEKMLAQAERGEVISILYLIENSDGTKEFDVKGHFRKRPDLAFSSACTGMYALCNFIHSEGLTPRF